MLMAGHWGWGGVRTEARAGAAVPLGEPKRRPGAGGA